MPSKHNTERPATPHTDLMKAVRREANAIGQFIDFFCQMKRLHLCKLNDAGDTFSPADENTMDLIAQFFGVDLKEVQKETEAVARWESEQN